MTWLSLSEIPLRRVRRRYGPVAARLKEIPAFGGQGGEMRVLHRRCLRAALEETLPGGHDPVSVAMLEGRRRRVEKAARAHERLVDSAVVIPDHGLLGDRFLVCASPVTRPEGFEPLDLAVFLDVARRDVAQAVRELWGGLFLFAEGARPEFGLKRFEMGVLLTPWTPQAASCLTELSGEFHPAGPVRLPLPGQRLLEPPLLELDRSLARHTLPAYLRALEERLDVRLPRCRGAELTGSLSLADVTEDLLGVDVSRRGLVEDILGPPFAFEPKPPPRSFRDIPGLAARLARGLIEEGSLGNRVARLEASVRSSLDWAAEVQLSLLPDDALRHTLEEHLEVFERLAALSAEAEVNALMRGREYSFLTGLPVTELDLGLVVPPLAMLGDFVSLVEDAFESDGKQSVERALTALREKHPEIFYGGFSEPPAYFEELLEVLGDRRELPAIEGLLERARVRLDQKLAAVEARLPRLLLPSLSSLRGTCQKGVVLRERVRMAEVRAAYLLRRVTEEIDRRLPGLERGMSAGAALHCSLSELGRAVDVSGTSLRSRVVFRSVGRVRMGMARRSSGPYRFEQQFEPQQQTLAVRRDLLQLPLLLARPERVRYRGRAMDTLPTVARSLGLPLDQASPSRRSKQDLS